MSAADTPADVLDPMLYRNARAVAEHHSQIVFVSPTEAARCAFCGAVYPCDPARLARRGDFVARTVPWRQRMTALADQVSTAIQPGLYTERLV